MYNKLLNKYTNSQDEIVKIEENGKFSYFSQFFEILMSSNNRLDKNKKMCFRD